MDPLDLTIRRATYAAFVDLGRAPAAAEVGDRLAMDEASITGAWRRLHDAHALVLDAAGAIRMANPFAARPTDFRVSAGGRSWYANCGWDAFGIGAALHVDSEFETHCADCHERIEVRVREGRPDDGSLLWHVLVPAHAWWNDIGFT